MQRRRKRQQDDINTSAWMDTYSDTITLLLTFFILLYSFSTTDQEKLMKIAAAFEGQLLGKSISMEDTSKLTGLIESQSNGNKAYEDLVSKVNEVLKANGMEGVVQVREEDAGVVLQLSESILFDPAKAELKQESYRILQVICDIIPEFDNDIIVQGHTDNVPISTSKYETNWELSTARATEVLRYFTEIKGFDPKRFSASGSGEHKPIVANDSAENKAINRRVDILLAQKREK